MMKTQQTAAGTRRNNCHLYEHKYGYPEPETASSCRGCRFSADPGLYDAGCTHPDRCPERHPANEHK